MSESLLLADLTANLLTAAAAFLLLHQLRRPPKPTAPAVPPPSAESEPLREERIPLDEGFENLMRYQVKLGRGQTTGGGIS